MRTSLTITFALVCLLINSSCKKSSDPTPSTPTNPGGGEQELVTRFEIHLKNGSNNTDSTIAVFNDPEGEGVGALPTKDTLKVKAGVTYSAEVKIYDDTKNPVVVTSEEIEEEANYHRFHYLFRPMQSTSGVNLQVDITDKDTQNPAQPLGLKFTMTVGSVSGLGTLNINLRHFDEGSVKTQNPTDGEQDINLDFVVKVK